MRFQVIATAGVLALASCATPPARPSADSMSSNAVAAQQRPASESANPVEGVPLKVIMTDQITTGRLMQLRGTIINPHSEPVDGVRVQLVLFAPDDQGGARVLEIQQKELNTTIPPGDSMVLRWDVESLYLGSGSGRFLVAAYPKRLGDKDMPPPDHWKE